MPPLHNPLKLNPLQLRTLVLFQEMARHPELATPDPRGGGMFMSQIPHPHGNHFHIGNRVVASSDATGFANKAVWVVLDRKGLIRSAFPYALTLTDAGIAYDTGITDQILHGSDH